MNVNIPPSVRFYLAERDSWLLRAPGNLKPRPYKYVYMSYQCIYVHLSLSLPPLPSD